MRKKNLELCQVCKTDWALHVRCRTSKKSQEIHSFTQSQNRPLLLTLQRAHTWQYHSCYMSVLLQQVSEGLSHTDVIPNHSSPSPQILPLCIKRPHYTLDSEIAIFSFKFWSDQRNYQCVLLRYLREGIWEVVTGLNSSNLEFGYTKWNIEGYVHIWLVRDFWGGCLFIARSQCL